jgi:hypothetical protein
VAARRRGRPGQALRGHPARGEGHHRAGPRPGRHHRGHPGQAAAGRRGPAGRGRRRRRRHACRETGGYIAGSKDDGNREADYFPTVKGSQPLLQRAALDAVQVGGPRDPDHAEPDRGHGRIIRRSIRVTAAGDADFPHAARIARIRRDRYDRDGALISKEIVHAITSPDADRATAADLAAIARGQRGTESLHWIRDTAWDEDASTGYTGDGPQVMATLPATPPSACPTSPGQPR